MKSLYVLIMIAAFPVILSSKNAEGASSFEKKTKPSTFTGAKGEVKLITLDPGHFHAALVQKNNYVQVNPEVYVYAPKGKDLDEHLKRIEGYNSRAVSPTVWKETSYIGNDYLEKMLSEKRGNVVVVSGNNRIKGDYIAKSINAGLNVLADKPMVITADQFPALEKSFVMAQKKGLLLYDIMTERYSVTTAIQRELSMRADIFGTLEIGSMERPAVEMTSVHYFYKNVSGNTLVRPGWFFDVKQQGEGIVDVTTHLVDLVQWECFPDQILHKSDIQILDAKRWPTQFSKSQFSEVTKLADFPEYLLKDVKADKLGVFANGTIVYKIKNSVAKVTAIWDFKASEGAGDTHYSMLRGTLSDLEIIQGKEQKYDPTLYIHAKVGADLINLEKGILAALANLPQQGLALEKVQSGTWKIVVPEPLKIGHEAHFSQVAEKYLEYLKAGKLPEWEVPNMIAKYYTTTQALKFAQTNH